MLMCRWFLLSVLLFGFDALSEASIIDFETGSFLLSVGQTGRLDRFNFTAGGQPSSFLVAPVPTNNCIPLCISNGTQTLGAFNGATLTMDPFIPGELFALDSFDVAGTATAGSNRNATSIRVTGNLSGGGQVTQTFIVTPSAFQTLTLNSSFVELSSVVFDGLLPVGLNSPEFQLDNIAYSQATVPEPSSKVSVATVLLLTALAIVRRKFFFECFAVTCSRPQA